MRVGVDITPLQVAKPGGIGTSLYETLRSLVEMPALEIVLYGTAQPLIPFSDVSLDLDLPVRIASGPLARSNIAWIRYGAAAMLRKDRIDVFWGTRHVVPKDKRAAALVATVYDFWYATYPEQQPILNRLLNSLTMRATMDDADVVACISDAVSADARRFFIGESAKVRTVPLGVNAEHFHPKDEFAVAAVKARFGLSDRFLVAMDVFNPRKNATSVLEAVAMGQGRMRPLEVVAIGEPRATAVTSLVSEKARSLGLGDRVRFVGDVTLEELTALYSGAFALAYPSEYEGFGMPVLEAMACGCPVITSSTSSLPEVAGDAAILVSPADSAGMAQALVSLDSDPGLRPRLVGAGLARAQAFPWSRTAQGMLAAFEDALAVHDSGMGSAS